MDLKSIKEIVNSGLDNADQEHLIISIIATDKNAIPTILRILDAERSNNRELLLDTNAELSRALVVLKDPNLKWNKKILADPKWVVGEIIKHYQKWKHTIGCTFNIEELK
jgi:Tfp pilus assembly pilus retraction ATPase PilT